MAHEIERDDIMAYRASGGATWHGLGTPVGDDVTDEEFFRLSGLDWRVVQMPLDIRGKIERREAKGYKALVRSTDGKLLGIATDDYHPVQNSAIWAFFREFCTAGNMTLETAGSLCGGTRVWGLGKINGAEFDVAGIGNGVKDKTKMYALFSTGHKPGFATQAEITSIRVVCNNTLNMARNGGSDYRFKLTHRAAWRSRYEEYAQDVVKNGMKAMGLLHEKADQLAACRVDRDVETAYLVELLQPEILRHVLEGHKLTLAEMAAEREQTLGAAVLGDILDASDSRAHAENGRMVLDALVARNQAGKLNRELSPTVRRVRQYIESQPGADMTRGRLWGTYNAVTYYVDHQRGRTAASAVDSALFGAGAALKSKALDLAVEYTQRLARA